MYEGAQEKFDVFSVRDLRNRSGELLKDAETGHFSRLTKHGKPAILAMPVDYWLLSHSVHRAMALHL
ncbi:MAG: type II toxin-antitoxin system prevent-host-death family antitoxin [Gammaproteobacteria bacterium]|nr:type II toxin-antitoxin system prevent-host-death family antitoxin [Gammaproteobacteria bacterium]